LSPFAAQVTYGANTFVFNLGSNDGQDVMGDFNSSQDILDFHGVTHFGSNTAVQDVNLKISSFVNDGANHLKVNFTSGGSLTFNNIAFSSLAPADITAHDISKVVSNISQVHASIL